VSPGVTYFGGPRVITQPFPSQYEPPSGVANPSSLNANATRSAAIVFTEGYVSASADLYHGAALQTAIWESIYQNFTYAGYSVDGGAHSFNAGTPEYAAFDTVVHQYLSVLQTANIDDHKYDAWQWVVRTAPSGGNTAQYLITVPEPTAVAWAAVAMAGLVAAHEYRRRVRSATRSLELVGRI
jgi:hypothetical protein